MFILCFTAIQNSSILIDLETLRDTAHILHIMHRVYNSENVSSNLCLLVFHTNKQNFLEHFQLCFEFVFEYLNDENKEKM